MNHPYLPWQSTHMSLWRRVATFMYAIYIIGQTIAQARLTYQAIFIHEMAHIYTTSTSDQCAYYEGHFYKVRIFCSLGSDTIRIIIDLIPTNLFQLTTLSNKVKLPGIFF